MFADVEARQWLGQCDFAIKMTNHVVCMLAVVARLPVVDIAFRIAANVVNARFVQSNFLYYLMLRRYPIN